VSCVPTPLLRGAQARIFLVVIFVAIGLGLWASTGPEVFALIGPFAGLGFLIFIYRPLRDRGLCVDLHQHGLVVRRGLGRIEITLFEDVDEVWMDLDVVGGAVTVARALRLVLHGGGARRVPATLSHADQLLREVILHCSYPLQAQATSALRAGDTLTFGDVQIDEIGIRRRRWSARWDELSLVRFMRGRLHLFRRQRILPWRTIRLDRVPHPTVFAKLVRDHAKKLEDDERFGMIR